MHKMPIGPMGADRKIPIDTQPINMDRIVPTQEISQLNVQNYKKVSSRRRIDDNFFDYKSFRRSLLKKYWRLPQVRPPKSIAWAGQW